MNEVFIALISAVFGGFGIKIIDGLLLPRVKQVDIATQIRDELRKEIIGYKEEVRGLRTEVDFWRRNYSLLIELLLKNKIDIPDELLYPQAPPTTKTH